MSSDTKTGSAPTAETPSPSFDQVLERLRQVVDRLEAGELTLEQSLAAFEEGVKLSRRGAEILDGAERRVDLLLRGEDGSVKTQPFASDPEQG
jgi:exodeoxyribonuclease VII small subunit